MEPSRSLKLLICLSAALILFTTVEGKKRVKRQKMFRVISEGQQFPCESSEMQRYADMGVPRVELNDEQKLELYHQLGGEFLSSFMGAPGRSKLARERGLSASPWRTGKKVDRKRTSLSAGLSPMEPVADAPEDSLKSEPTTYEYCSNRTDPTVDPQYLHMCTSCARSTLMGQDVWPTELYETDCISTQSNCLFYQGTANGRCQQTKLWVSILRKSAGECVIALADGSTVVTEDWYLDQVQINVGCECTVNKDSEFR